MIKKTRLLILFIILFTTTLANADVPPPPGYNKIKVSFVIETNEDLSDYRFFFDFSGALQEVEVKSMGKTNIPPLGGGARYASGDFMAIPKKNLAAFGSELTFEQLSGLSESLSNKKIEGVIELGEHIFIQTIKGGRRDSAKTYLLVRKADTLQMSPKKKSSTKKKVASLFVSEEEETEMPDSKNNAIGGVFLSLFFVTGGVFLFRKSQGER